MQNPDSNHQNHNFREEDISLLRYKPELQPYFESLNRAWLTRYFTIEPLDEYVLTQPGEAIIKNGGSILFVRLRHEIVGTAGLKNLGNGVLELTKMAVDERFQGLGIGKFLCKAAIAEAKILGASRLILYTQSGLSTALGIYRKCGFQQIPIEEGKYKRADVMMELFL